MEKISYVISVNIIIIIIVSSYRGFREERAKSGVATFSNVTSLVVAFSVSFTKKDFLFYSSRLRREDLTMSLIEAVLSQRYRLVPDVGIGAATLKRFVCLITHLPSSHLREVD